MKILIVILPIILLSFRSFSQDIAVSDYRGELNIKISLIDDKRIERGVEMLNDARKLEIEGLNILEVMDENELMEGMSDDYKKAIKKLQNASAMFQEGHNLLYVVFNENCVKFSAEMRKLNHYAAGMQKAKYYEMKGEQTLDRSNLIRSMVNEADKAEWIQYKMHEAFELEKLTIRDKGRALQIYQDFPVEYDYKWENDITTQEVAKIFSNPAVNIPPEEVFSKRPITYDTIPEGGPIVFKVQIAAHVVPLTDDYLKSFYTGKEEIIEVQEGQWFKYQIGQFDSFKDADDLRIKCRVPRSFVVAYQQDKKITIHDALKKLQAVR